MEEAEELISAFFQDALVGSAEQYVENFGSQLRRASESVTEANERLSKTDTSRLRLIREEKFLCPQSWERELSLR
jgi:hypothetical protein